MRSETAEDLAQKVAEAVLAVPGVACLRPGLRSLLRRAATRPPAARAPGTPGSAGSAGSAVRLTFDAPPPGVGLPGGRSMSSPAQSNRRPARPGPCGRRLPRRHPPRRGR
ncbi:hypothetical protein GCM10010215_35580 [Streptomyces virginiae]|nr:hypothetical protein GCM10010215_35580 [Streptomyces virginiae]